MKRDFLLGCLVTFIQSLSLLIVATPLAIIEFYLTRVLHYDEKWTLIILIIIGVAVWIYPVELIGKTLSKKFNIPYK